MEIHTFEHACLFFCVDFELQQSDVVKKQNQYCLKEKLFSELYEEIDRMDPVFRYLLAAQLRGKAKEGMSSLRQPVSSSSATSARKPAQELDEHT